MAARAYAVTDPAEMAKVLELFGRQVPEYRNMPQPDLSAMRLFMVVPAVISILDYRQASAIATSSRSRTPIAGPSSARASSRRRCCA